ncbi:hypothetical protein PMI11_03087 [Rhizobium sp. CF142]|nr:hypothetical protein PMI11_03087 [Rhizobium sp. CF142]
MCRGSPPSILPGSGHGLRPVRSSISLSLTEWAAETARTDATLYRFYPHGCIIPYANECRVFRARYPRGGCLVQIIVVSVTSAGYRPVGPNNIRADRSKRAGPDLHQRRHQSQQWQRDYLQSGREAAPQPRFQGGQADRLPWSFLRLSCPERQQSVRDLHTAARRPRCGYAPHRREAIAPGRWGLRSVRACPVLAQSCLERHH